MALSKKTRFEVFKRDSFTCQYCGRKAPDVVLQADHIEPIAKGGTDDLINLITSCFDCNSGKSDRRLSDGSVVAKQHAQLAILQERQEQLSMLLEWQKSLIGLEQDSIDKIAEFWVDLSGWGSLGLSVSDQGKQRLRKWQRQFGTEALLSAMRQSSSYFTYDAAGDITQESSEIAFSKIGGICFVTANEKEKPWLKEVFYIRAMLRRNLSYVRESEARELLETAFEFGGTAAELRRIAARRQSWTRWQSDMCDYLDFLTKDGE